ncbi:MAG TPA: FAD-linked oxidase C-terminal domain-containing protein [Stellaceae bacterium]|nr:FAD-linked oxidase C-terminal domain-containing protein [Stellaceae bacterium]
MTIADTFAPLRPKLATGRPLHVPNRTEARQDRDRAADLAQALSRAIEGEVRFDAGSRALYATDLSIYRQVPIGVVIPRHIGDVEATVAACRERQVPILGRGCGTSLSGQTCNVAVVIDFSKYMNRIVKLDPAARLAEVEPGVINEQLRKAAGEHGLTYAPDPATKHYCTLGGNIGNNSCGAHTISGGKTVANVETLDILSYDGLRMTVGATSDEELARIEAAGGRRAEIYGGLKDLAGRYGDEVRRRYPKIPRRVSGYNLDELLPENGFNLARALVGSEGTLALILGATVRLLPASKHRALAVIGYPDIASAADDCGELRGLEPDALEAFDGHCLENMHRKGRHWPGENLLPDGHSWLIVEFSGAEPGEAKDKAERACERLKRGRSRAVDMRLYDNQEPQQQIWAVRENGVGSSRVPGEEDTWPSWEDAAVPPERLGDYLRDFHKLNDKYNYRATVFGHFGDGCVHARMNFGLKTTEGVARFRTYMEEATGICLRYGGSLSGEHGDGQAKGELLPRMFGADLIQAFREFKTIWDPHWRMNPGKIIDAYPLDSNLRLGPDYAPRKVETYFHFPEDHGSFAEAAERCFGVGKCRAPHGQTMCPSFQATREEMHSTRGRAHLLFEMMRGDALHDGWRSEAVREALDLCLQCKGCKHDCPVSVDMATYKAEFLAHHYKGRLRPRSAYSMGLMMYWARLAMLMPGVVNFALRLPGLAPALKTALGFTTERPAPAFAPETFQAWFARRARENGEDDSRPPVILWPDTFNNYFRPDTAKAAVAVLEDAGYRVVVPEIRLCCGRPFYDYGFLDLARRHLRQILDVLRPAIRAGVPVVGLEPSCVSVFRDELRNLMFEDEDAHRLACQTRTLAEQLMATPDWEPPRLSGKVLLQSHCHTKAVLDADAQHKLFKKIGLELVENPTGCCGQAGSFGYESEHYAVSMTIAEQALLPAVRRATDETLIAADGFSCREQIEHGSARHALHPAEIVALALKERHIDSARAIEAKHRQPAAALHPAALGGAAAAVAAGGALLFWLSARNRR